MSEPATAIVLFKSAREIQSAPELFSKQTASVLKPEAEKKRDEVVATASGVECIKSPAAQQIAANCLLEIQGLLSSIEEGRKALKKPFDDFGKKIQTDVAALIGPLEAEKARLKKMMGEYQSELEQKAREEQAVRDREVERLAQEREKLEQLAPTAETEARREEINRQMGANLVEAEAPKPAGVSTRPVRKFRVLDLAKLYAARPDLVKLEERAAEINKVIRAPGNESVLIDGLELYTEMEVVPR